MSALPCAPSTAPERLLQPLLEEAAASSSRRSELLEEWRRPRGKSGAMPRPRRDGLRPLSGWRARREGDCSAAPSAVHAGLCSTRAAPAALGPPGAESAQALHPQQELGVDALYQLH